MVIKALPDVSSATVWVVPPSTVNDTLALGVPLKEIVAEFPEQIVFIPVIVTDGNDTIVKVTGVLAPLIQLVDVFTASA